MQTLERPSTSAVALHGARQLAVAEPGARMACPVCAASLKGANYERHLVSKHPTVDARVATDVGGGDLVLVGIDQRIRRGFGVLVALCLAILVAMVAVQPGPVTAADGGEATIGDIVGTPFVIVLGACALLLVAVAVLYRAGAFRARLSVKDGEVRVRQRLGTRAVRVALPAPVEVGTLFVRRRADGHHQDGDGASIDVRTGAYLRIGTGRRAITVGCPTATGLRKHWTGWSSGPRRKWWDVNLDAPSFVELQYALAGGGVLTPSR